MPWGQFFAVVGQAAIVLFLLVFVGAVVAGILQAVRRAPATSRDPQETHERLLSPTPATRSCASCSATPLQTTPGGRCTECGQQA